MNEQRPESMVDSFEERSRALFNDSVDGLDFALRSRLTQARNAAIEAASAKRRPWFTRVGVLAPAGMSAAAVLGAVLWLGSPFAQHAVTVNNDGQPNLEDLELVASDSDAMDMLQDDVEFYDWADKAASSGPATSS
jgi:negative regulator of sigma E activity